MSELIQLLKEIKVQKFPQSLDIKVIAFRGRSVKPLLSYSTGKSFKYFDVASVTKLMVTVPLIMKLVEQKLISLSDPIGLHLRWLGPDASKPKISELLNQTSGLVWWRPYFKKVKTSDDMKGLIRKEKLLHRGKNVYSDPGFIILGWLVEEKFCMSLDEAAQKFIFNPLKMNHTFFERVGISKGLFAPTRKIKFRGLIQGQVFDDNCWAMGGVSGHAGVFSTMADMTRMAAVFFEIYFNDSHKSFLRRGTLRLFSSKSKGDWGLGFLKPSRPSSTGGRLISLNSFGQIGYTGTSVWFDLKRKVAVIILSNGTYPKGNNLKYKPLRPQLHDAIWKKVDRL